MRPSRRLIWDLPTRLFHWLFAASILVMLTGDELLPIRAHAAVGHFILALLIWRFLWGFVGGRLSRFASFFPTPSRLRAYFRGQHRPGHNPLGALSIFAMLGLVGSQILTGLSIGDDVDFVGPLNPLISDRLAHLAEVFHKHVGWIAILSLVILHVAAIAAYHLRGRSLLGPMIHGGAKVAEQATEPVSTQTPGSLVLAAILFAASLLASFSLSGLL